MWRGGSFSTVLHGTVILLLLFGLPSLPVLFKRATDDAPPASDPVSRSDEAPARPDMPARNAAPASASPRFDLPAIEVTLVPESPRAEPREPARPADRAAAMPAERPARGLREPAAAPPGDAAPADVPPDATRMIADPARRAAERGSGADTGAAVATEPAAPQSVPLDLLPQTVAAMDRRLREATSPAAPAASAADERRQGLTAARIATAAARGHPLASYNQAVLLLKGIGAPPHPDEAIALLERAAERNYLPAQMLLGWLAAGGLGRPRDLPRADFWWSLAEQRGSAPAARARALLKPHLRVDDIVQAQRRRAEWHRLMALVAPADVADANPETLDEMLRSAAEQGDAGKVMSALIRGADADGRDRYGRNAIINAAWRGREQIVALVLEHGVEVDAADDRQRTPLIWGAINGHRGVVERLLAAGADPDRRDADGATALIRAAWNGHRGVVERLLAAGARADVRDASGATALDRARQSGQAAIVRLLESASAGRARGG